MRRASPASASTMAGVAPNQKREPAPKPKRERNRVLVLHACITSALPAAHRALRREPQGHRPRRLSERPPEVQEWALQKFRSFRSEGQFVPFSVGKDTVIFPGFDGGAEWGGASADPETGTIHITPGKQIPGIPAHQIKVGVDHALTDKWRVGTDVAWVGPQWYVGDGANQNVKLADYWFANAHPAYQFRREVEVYGVVNNLFNRKFATYGTYFEPQGIQFALANPPTDHRIITPAQPLSVYIGVRGKLQ